MYTNIGMRLSEEVSLNAHHFGIDGKARIVWDAKDNNSPSVFDAVHQRELEDHIEKARTQKEAQKPVQVKVETQEKAALLTDPVARVEISRNAIIEHLEERIGAFLMQIIDCYDTDDHYTIGTTVNQTQSTPAVHFVPEEGIQFPENANTKMEHNAAHHGTIPCLYAYDRVEWTAWRAKGSAKADGKPQARIYLKNSDTYYQNNACTGLASVINKVDIVIDGNTTERLAEFGAQKTEDEMELREFSIGLLNQAARREITPLEGFERFLLKLQLLIHQNHDHPKPDHRAVFQILHGEIDAIQQQYQGKTKECVAHLMGLHLPPGAPETVNLDALVFPRHYRIIRQKDLYQNQLAARIDILSEDILEGTERKPLTFPKAIKTALMREASLSSEKVHKLFQRYYNMNGLTLVQMEQETYKPALALVRTPRSQLLIKEMVHDFSLYLHNFAVDESNFRSGLLKEIRDARNISLRKFSRMHNTQFPDAHSLNREQLRRIEGGCVRTSPDMVERFAAVLGVPISYFNTNFSDVIF